LQRLQPSADLSLREGPQSDNVAHWYPSQQPGNGLRPCIPESVWAGFENKIGTYVKKKKFSAADVAAGVSLVTTP